MSGPGWLNATLAVAVAAMAAFVWLRPAPDPAGQALTTLKAAEASAIRIERPGGPAIALERRGGEWHMTAPLVARADSFRVQRLLAIADARSLHRLEAVDLARFDLERPAAQLTIDGQRFDFGMVNPVSQEQYVLTGGAVYTVNGRYGAALPARPEDLVEKPPPPSAGGQAGKK